MEGLKQKALYEKLHTQATHTATYWQVQRDGNYDELPFYMTSIRLVLLN